MYLVLLLVLLGSDSLDSGKTIYISYKQTGGFAGMNRSLEMNSDTLNIKEQNELNQLIADADFFNLVIEENDLERSRDQFHYEISIKQNDQKRSLKINDSNVPEKLRPLINYLSGKVRSFNR